MDAKRIESMRDLMRVQGANGNWEYDPYMQGMYNGMELMMAMAEGREPVFKEAPPTWGRDIHVDEAPVAQESAH